MVILRRSWWAIAQCTVWSLCVVVFSPFFDDDLCFPQALEDLSVEQFISEPAIEALAVTMCQENSAPHCFLRPPHSQGLPGSM